MKAPYFVASPQPINIYFFSENKKITNSHIFLTLPHILFPLCFQAYLSHRSQNKWSSLLRLGGSVLSFFFLPFTIKALNTVVKIMCCLPFFAVHLSVVYILTSVSKILLKVKGYKSQSYGVQ